MSIEALNYAVRVGDRLGDMDKKRITPTEALLLVHLCNHVDGQWRWESDKKTLARRCITTPRTIQTGLNKFQQWGLISLRRAIGHRGQDAEGFEFWVHEQNLRALSQSPEAFFAVLDAGSENSSTLRNSGSENISHPEDGLWITGSENSSAPVNGGEENSSTLPGSEIPARSDVENFHPQRACPSFKPSREPSYSSSPPHEPEPSGPGEPPATAVGEEEPLPGASSGIDDSEGPPAASGGDPPNSPKTNHTPEGPTAEALAAASASTVDVGKVQSMLTGVASASVSVQTAQAYADLVLGRASEPVIENPTGFVAASIRKSPGRTKADLATLKPQPSPAGPDVSGSSNLAGAAGPVLCPLPAHRERGRRQATCPDCRGITGEFEFPELVSQEIFDQLTGWQQKRLRDCGVEVGTHVDEATMSRSVIYAPGQAAENQHSRRDAA